MSKSLKRVIAALEGAGLPADILEVGQARTAAEAAASAGCHIDQIAKSIIFRGTESNRCFLFLTAGGNQVSHEKSTKVAGEALGKADAQFIRASTGFAIGGVAPIGHLQAPKSWIDPRLLEFQTVFAAAGTPRHIFPIAPTKMQALADADVADFCD